MPSTYTTNLGIEKIGTGEQSGTWGTTTNTNFDLIDQGVNGIVQVTLAAVGSTGSPNALTIDNGALSDGRNKFIEFVDGGDLGGTAYVQLQPNDSEKVAFIRNSLSGSRSIIIFQGTYNASNDFEIPNGADVVLKFDGAGASATVTQVFENLTVSSATLASGVTVNAILDEDNMASDSDTALATQQSIKAYVDSQVTAQDLDIAGDTGTGAVDLDSQSLTIAGTANEIETSASGQTITVGLPNAVTIADLTATTADINGGTIDGTVIGGSSAAAGSFTTISASGEIAANGGIALGDNDKATFGAGDDLQIYHDGSNSRIADTGTGYLAIDTNGSDIRLTSNGFAEYMAKFEQDGPVTLYHNGSDKLATTSTGIDITGTVTADGFDNTGSFSTNTSSSTFTSGSATRVNIETTTDTYPTLAMDADRSGADYTIGRHSYEWNGTEVARINITSGVDTTNKDDGRIYFSTAESGTLINRALISYNGDISFYEDTGTTAKFFWDASAESLGIGTTTPNFSLDVEGAGNLFRVNATSGNSLQYISVSDATSIAGINFGDTGSTSAGSIYYRHTGDSMAFSTAGTERMRIDSSGNLLVGKSSTGIGTTGVELSSGGYIYGTRNGNSLALNRLSTDGATAVFQKDGTTVGSISVTSSTTTYNITSDQRLKDNIVDAPSSSDDIDAIQVRSFDWKADGSHQKYGMIAQELMTVAPEAVSGDPESDEMMGVDYSKLVPMLIKEIQSLRARVAQLEN